MGDGEAMRFLIRRR